MLTIHLAPGREARLHAGHPWIYRSEIARVSGEAPPGAIARIEDHRGRFLGQATLNLASQIAARLIAHDEAPVTPAFLEARIRRAGQRPGRSPVGPDACRLVFGEADHLPGLIVDRYADVLVLQILTAGMERWREAVVQALQRVYTPRAIFERSDASSRKLEGLEPRTGFAFGGGDTTVVIQEAGVAFFVDVAAGQKTGFFLDQRENRQVVRRLARERTVLDCFTYSGGFALSAAAGGAASVLGVDISPDALAWAERSAGQNGCAERCTWIVANAFDYLRALVHERRRFGLIVLDPPAFTKGRQSVESALRGYHEINLRAMRLLAPGGVLVTCSCSYHVDTPLFLEMLRSAADDAHREFRILEGRTQASDHPILLAMKETQYLKCVVLEAAEE
ncbi:MAG TPA: class I SAM-dependent rRNA methyltransferase [Candidatus Baltobacteraceae bacterium]|nr:class I SAM-dependent rRNA methyltransferase [Candidatus Baltobacteraceae bacterium]